ncbi:hypothetical protein [Novosphingobium sp. B1]|uniref:hypothetical protein n=1 Tax=Novosphingobium sp. B1 TaxID=1938756 RepID=UPI0009FE5CD0|nr:hypothetical protein [Novosphingobium sp. B1]
MTGLARALPLLTVVRIVITEQGVEGGFAAGLGVVPGFGRGAASGFEVIGERCLPIVPDLVGRVVVGKGVGLLVVGIGAGFESLEEAVARGVGLAGGGGDVRALGQRQEHAVEVFGEVVDGLGRGGGAGVEPGEMGEQEPRVEALALAHGLAPEPDRLSGAMECAGGEDLLGRLARMDQRRVPAGGKGRIAATADIGRLLRHPRHPRRHAHLPMAAEVIEKPRDADGGELVGVEERRRVPGAAPLLPSRLQEGNAPFLPLGAKRRQNIIRQPDVPPGGNPPPAKRRRP